MKRIIYAIFVVLLINAFAASAAAQSTVTVSATLFTDGGSPATGWIYFAPQISGGQPASYRNPAGGISTVTPLKAKVTAGAFSLTMPNTALTNPANICFSAAFSAGGWAEAKIGPGFSCVQPHYTASGGGDWCQAGACNFDNLIPNLSPLALVVTGPQGPAGPTGPQGPAGSGGSGGVPSVNAITTAVTVTGPGVSTAGSTITVDSPPYNLPTTTYAFVGDSNIGSDNHDLSLPITATAVSCNGTICTITNSGVNGLAAGDWIDAGWLASPSFLAGGGNCQITGVCLFQVLAAGLTTTQFEFAYTLNTGTGTGGTVYTANDYLPFQIMQQPQFKNHGTVFVHPGVIDYLAATGYAAVLHPISPAVTGNPGFLILAGDQDRIQNAPCTQAAIKADYQSVWEQAHVDGWKIVQATSKSAAYGLFTCGTKADYDAVEAWKRGQGKSASTTGTTQPAGAYWDSLVDVGTVITDNNDGVFTTGANGYFLPGGTAILAPLFNAAMTDNGAVLPKFNCNANGNCAALDGNNQFTSLTQPQKAISGWYGGALDYSVGAHIGEGIWGSHPSMTWLMNYGAYSAFYAWKNSASPYYVSDVLPGPRQLCWSDAAGGEISQTAPLICFSIDSSNNYINVGDGSAPGDASKSMKMAGLTGPAVAPTGACTRPGEWELSQDGLSSICMSDGGTGYNWITGSIGGPPTAPSGSCVVYGIWVFSADGHATFCLAGTWTTKI